MKNTSRHALRERRTIIALSRAKCLQYKQGTTRTINCPCDVTSGTDWLKSDGVIVKYDIKGMRQSAQMDGTFTFMKTITAAQGKLTDGSLDSGMKDLCQMMSSARGRSLEMMQCAFGEGTCPFQANTKVPKDGCTISMGNRPSAMLMTPKTYTAKLNVTGEGGEQGLVDIVCQCS